MKIPDHVLNRLTLYHFILDNLKEDEINISSTKIAQLLDIDPSQVRKDIKYLNNSGKCRVGYNVKALKISIERLLGFKQVKDAFIVGAGNLGSALAKYTSFKDYGLNILAMFDNDPKKIGTTINGKEVFDFAKLGNLIKRLNVEIAILTVPKEHAQGIASYLAGAGIKYIWNFAPCVLEVPKNVKVWNENLIGSFLQFTNNDEIERNNNDD
ncbi:MAG: redox-sensing transcriptional repressor Rex [Candidatus Gastranaerophilales bacterium]|nr:redox-sensing transcriptional repressor Rex [Candidatus Gastranaerophilales bacterium]